MIGPSVKPRTYNDKGRMATSLVTLYFTMMSAIAGV